MTDDRDIVERLEAAAEGSDIRAAVRPLMREAAALIRTLDEAVAEVLNGHGVAVSTAAGDIIYAAVARHAARTKRSAGDE